MKLFDFMKHSLFNREADELNHMLLELLDALMSKPLHNSKITEHLVNLEREGAFPKW